MCACRSATTETPAKLVSGGLLRELRPAVALLDIGMPELSGLDVLKACTADGPRPGKITANPLSEREREVLRASAGGPTIRAIADELFLSASTVRNYLSQAVQKTGAKTRAEAYATGLNNGWI